MTREHVWPAWFRGLFDVDGFEHSRRRHDGLMEEWEAPGLNVVLKRVCNQCNTQWMARLLTVAVGHFVFQVYGWRASDQRRISLPPDIATWVVRVAPPTDAVCLWPPPLTMDAEMLERYANMIGKPIGGAERDALLRLHDR